MQLIFRKNKRGHVPSKGKNLACLTIDNWDDFCFKSLFSLTVFNENAAKVYVGDLKIGYRGQSEGWTEQKLPQEFNSLEEKFFSLGQDPEYYQNVVEKLSPEFAAQLLKGLRDIVHDPNHLSIVENEEVFKTSLF